MQRRYLFAALAVALVALALWFAVMRRHHDAPTPPQPTLVQNAPPVSESTPATQAAFRGQQPAGQSTPATHVPTPFPEPPPPPAGGIRGRVIDESGKPVAGALVDALPQRGNVGDIPHGYTNRRGMFTIRGMEVGKYELSVSKKEAGFDSYWNRFVSAGFIDVGAEVTVYEKQTVSYGDLHLGPKVGKLVGTLRDATTKKGIVSTTSPEQTRHVILCRLDDPKNCFDASPNRNGDFEILVPPVPFTIEATAPGYQKKDLGVLRLRGGEIKRLDILLAPTN